MMKMGKKKKKPDKQTLATYYKIVTQAVQSLQNQRQIFVGLVGYVDGISFSRLHCEVIEVLQPSVMNLISETVTWDINMDNNTQIFSLFSTVMRSLSMLSMDFGHICLENHPVSHIRLAILLPSNVKTIYISKKHKTKKAHYHHFASVMFILFNTF